MKCYKQALAIDKSNMQVLRDLSQLQVQCMDTEGLLHTRHKLLALKPGHKFNWMGFALAHHLAKNYSMALKVLSAFENLLDPADSKYEKSEFLMYRNMIMFESGDFDATITHLDTIENTIVDKVGWLETRAKCYLGMNQTEDAHQCYLKLIKHNQEHRGYIMDYVNTAATMADKKKLTCWTDVLPNDICDVVTAILEDLEKEIPGSHVVKRLALDVTYGDKFRQRLIGWIEPYLKRAIPALFSALKSLYNNPEKIPVMEELFINWEKNLRTSNRFSPDSDEVQLPQSHLWSLMLLSAHYFRINKFEDALTWINKAIEHTPTVEMLYILKARILKGMGKLEEALEVANKARILDTADKYLNTKYVKYLLRNNKVKEADHWISVFGAPLDEVPSNNTTEMQCMWYEIEEGDAYWRMGDTVTALKKWLLVDKHFMDMSEDQMDFHQYCLRKLTVRYYIQLLRWDKRSWSYPVYLKAARRVVKGYLNLFDQMQAGEDPQTKVLNLLKTDEDEKEATEGSKEDNKKSATNRKSGKGKGKQKPKKKQKDDDDDEDEDEDVNKEFNMKVDMKTPLEAATRFAEALQMHAVNDIDTHLLSYELYLKKNKPLLAIRHALQAANVDNKHPDLAAVPQQLQTLVDKIKGETKPVVIEVYEQAMAELKAKLKA
eukprot:TRINITY_DN67265_c5_g1_i3.p1 TRINITY_DN67265_c5_g1~~TRINITY_DN67265_c5_g1_i3.p1  ORF type:complete len:777 (+),score=98.35 TRINITY_DN67265_c5_g1_i3:351-2333(+)